MIRKYKNRELNIEKKVKVYRNLNNHLLSIKQKNIVAHADFIVLKDVTFHVMPAGHKETLRKKQKTVHAYAKGFISNEILNSSKTIKVFYDPFVAGYFRDENGNLIEQVSLLSISHSGEMLAII